MTAFARKQLRVRTGNNPSCIYGTNDLQLCTVVVFSRDSHMPRGDDEGVSVACRLSVKAAAY